MELRNARMELILLIITLVLRTNCSVPAVFTRWSLVLVRRVGRGKLQRVLPIGTSFLFLWGTLLSFLVNLSRRIRIVKLISSDNMMTFPDCFHSKSMECIRTEWTAGRFSGRSGSCWGGGNSHGADALKYVPPYVLYSQPARVTPVG